MKDVFDYIRDVETLSRWCRSQRDVSEIGVDTEFERRSTYYPELCLVQLATPKGIACVDPILCEDLNPLADFLNDSSKVKVLHAARQDLEVLELIGINFGDSFVDTQMAAALLGEEEQIGYGDLVRKHTEVEIDKRQQRANWKRRPLPKRQLDYAVSDVHYLLPIYESLRRKLECLGRLDWLKEECTNLGKITSSANSDMSWQRLKNVGGLKIEVRERAFSLARWREKEAKRVNTPRSWLLKDSEIKKIAIANPQDTETLLEICEKSLTKRTAFADGLLCAIREAGELRSVIPSASHRLTDEERSKAKVLLEAGALLAEELSIKPTVLMTTSDSKKIVQGERLEKYFSGWRSIYFSETFHKIGLF